MEPKEHERSNKPHMIYIYSNNDRHRVPKTFTPLHHTSLHFTTLVDTSLLHI